MCVTKKILIRLKDVILGHELNQQDVFHEGVIRVRSLNIERDKKSSQVNKFNVFNRIRIDRSIN